MILIGFFIFLFVVYLLSRDDFVFLRRSITLDQLFDTIFVTSLATLLFSRIVFVALHFKSVYINPLVFFLIPYFPGLSLSGALIGGVLFSIFYLQYYKYPTTRILDIFSIAFLFSFSVTDVVQGGILLSHRVFVSGGVDIGVGFLAFCIALLSNRLFSLSNWKDGGVSLFSLSAISLLALCSRLVSISLAKRFVFDLEIVIFLVFLFGIGIVWLWRLKNAGK